MGGGDVYGLAMAQAGAKVDWRWMAALVAWAAAVPMASGVSAFAHPPARPGECWVNDELLGAADCQMRADADWEGLSGEEQDSIRDTGLHGTEQDQLVIDYRQAKLDAAASGGSWKPVLDQDAGGRWIVCLVPVDGSRRSGPSS